MLNAPLLVGVGTIDQLPAKSEPSLIVATALQMGPFDIPAVNPALSQPLIEAMVCGGGAMAPTLASWAARST